MNTEPKQPKRPTEASLTTGNNLQHQGGVLAGFDTLRAESQLNDLTAGIG